MTHTLVLVRHAHAQPRADGGDHARPLSTHGHEQAQALGTRLAQIVPTFDIAVYSDAQRTTETARHLLRSCPAQKEWADRSLYIAVPHDILTLISTVEDARAILVVGHEPTISELGRLLASDPRMIPGGVATATALVLRHESEWAGLGAHSCELEIL